ncbi:MAG: 3-methyl-2-oxobutanoate hydroxymethyltransferase [Clostridiales bacterium]|nr:3-methyl-2-oxobutanoate hydroxymethyltransferase [Clostridiales bacterium]
MNVQQLLGKKQRGEKIVMITAYGYPSGILAEQAGVDIVLVGDSLGNVVLGYETTTPVTLEDILHHTKPVARAVKNALVVADMPFGSFQISNELALANAILLIKEGGAAAVKLEGGMATAPVITALSKHGIPVMAHIGLLPQTASMWQGFRCQGRNAESARCLQETALILEQAGAFSIVLECIAAEVAANITASLQIPTIGIGAGADCDGQVLVFHDLVGLNEGHMPRFAKQYGQAAVMMRQAISAYANDVRNGTFPDAEHNFLMENEELKKMYG